MQFIKKYALAIFLGILGVGFVVLLAVTLFKPRTSSNDPNANKSQDQTLLDSPYAKTSESLAVNYGGDADPNADAVKQRFKIFGLSKLPMAEAVKKDLESFLPEAVNREVIPTYPPTYLQISPDSVACDPENNCTMEVYVDSPETLFELKTGYHDGVPSFVLTQKPWEGLTP